MKTQVILPLRKLQPTEKYESVIVRVTDLNVSNEEHAIQMNATGHNVWRADVFNPVTSQVDKINYFFDVTVSSKGLFGRNYNKMRSTMYKMKEASVIRQVFDETNIPNDEIISHLKDIIIESDALSLLDCTQQIEDFCKDINFKMDAAEQIYKSLLAEIDKSSQKQLLLCIIVFGNLFKSYHTIASRILKPELMWTLLNSLASYNSMDLTVSSSEYMFDVAKVFCRIVLGKQYCFLSAISILYPFFEEKYISNRLIEAVRRKETLVAEPGGEETENIIFTLFEKVFQRAESEQARRLLEQLILHIPLKEAMKIYKNLQTKDSALVISGGIQSVLHATLLESVRLFLRSQKRSIDELKQLMELTDMIQEISIASRSELENAIVSCVISVMRSQTEALKEMILRKDLFVTVKSQLNLIKRLTSLRLPYLHFLLFDILVDAKFVEALSRAENVWFCECFDNAILNIKREGNEPKKQMEDVYTYLARAFEFCALRHSKELITYIDKIGIEYLKAIDLKKLMRMAKVIEELAETNTSIGDLFKEHVQSILKHQYESNYHEMLIDLCGTNGKLRINSR